VKLLAYFLAAIVVATVSGCRKYPRTTYYNYVQGSTVCDARELERELHSWEQRFSVMWIGEREEPPPARRLVMVAHLPPVEALGLRMYVSFVHHQRGDRYDLKLELVAQIKNDDALALAKAAPQTYDLGMLWYEVTSACGDVHVASR
jgi:hypothetical protein